MWRPLKRPGPAGRRRDLQIAQLNEDYGEGNWRISWYWLDHVIPRETALGLYEDGYYEFFRSNRDELSWLVNNASDVYDINPEDMESGLDYTIQQHTATHLQDIAIRRVILRLGMQFQGDKLLQVRGKDSEGSRYSPGIVPFHLPENITTPHFKGWWVPNSIEDFYQSNKVLEVLV